uniref:Uncharacterized protein n=1 Tax=Rhizophora mucronata TaxID=61149 RepID=A0A2P2K0T4_RHIMU
MTSIKKILSQRKPLLFHFQGPMPKPYYTSPTKILFCKYETFSHNESRDFITRVPDIKLFIAKAD